MSNNDRIEQALATLPALLFAGDQFGIRELLESLYDAGATDLLADLCGVEQAAARWNVTERRVRAHIARLHEVYGIGRQFGGTWLVRRNDIDRHLPDQKYRVKEQL